MFLKNEFGAQANIETRFIRVIPEKIEVLAVTHLGQILNAQPDFQWFLGFEQVDCMRCIQVKQGETCRSFF